MEQTIRPGRGFVAVVLDEQDNVTPGGIYLPDSAMGSLAPRAPLGKVLAVGLDVEDFEVGDRVVVSGIDGHPCEVGDLKFRILKACDVLAKVG